MKQTLLLWINLFLCIATGYADDLFVSLDGDDRNTGAIESPLRTVEAALDHIYISESGDNFHVYLRAGTYHLQNPIVIHPWKNKKDPTINQSITISSWEDEQVIISGGRELKLDWIPHKNGIMKAHVSGDDFAFDELYINDRRYHMARYPNFDDDAKYFGGTSPDAVAPSHVESWADPTGGYLHALHEGLWGSKHYEIVGINPDHTLQLRGGWQENRGGGFDPDFRGGYHKEFLFVEHIREELDAPGEWYFDAASKTLLVYPYQNDDLHDADIFGTRLHELVVIEGSEEENVPFIHIDGLHFKYTSRVFMQPYERLLRGDWSIARLGALRLTNSSGCSVSNCVFENLGGNAVFVDGKNSGTAIAGNHFSKLGESAICVVGDTSAVRSPAISYANTNPQDEIDLTPGPKTKDYPRLCCIQNNLIHDIGFIGKQTAGVFISMAEEITVKQNTIFNCPRAAICINDGCWGGHIIEKNYAFNTVRESGDHGPFNSWGRDRFWKTSYNGGRDIEPFAKERALLDNYKTTHIRLNRFEHDGGHSWGIDLDDGSSNYHVYQNLCIGMGVKLREGFFRRVENNIIINGFGGFHVWFPGCDDVIERNIFVSDKPYQFIRANPSYAKSFDSNLFYDDGNTPRITGVGEPVTIAEWQKKGFDLHSIVADPKFVDPEHGNYQLRDDSPALALGFERFALDAFGTTKPEFLALVNRAKHHTNQPSASQDSTKQRIPDQFEWMGAVMQTLVGKDQMSAAGISKETGVIILSVSANSRAERLGLQAGDVILTWNGQPIDTVQDLIQRIEKEQSLPIRLTLMNAVERTVLISE